MSLKLLGSRRVGSDHSRRARVCSTTAQRRRSFFGGCRRLRTRARRTGARVGSSRVSQPTTEGLPAGGPLSYPIATNTPLLFAPGLDRVASGYLLSRKRLQHMCHCEKG